MSAPATATSTASVQRRPRRAAASSTPCPAAGRWIIDAAQSTLRVSVKVGLFATVDGSFGDVKGYVDLADNPLDSRVDVTVPTKSLTSGSACMDSLLHGAGIVDSAKNPHIGFVSRSVRPGEQPGTWLLDGLLATDGAVLDVTLQMSDPVHDREGLRFHAVGSLQSKDAVRLLSRPGVEKILGRQMRLDLTVVAVPDGTR